MRIMQTRHARLALGLALQLIVLVAAWGLTSSQLSQALWTGVGLLLSGLLWGGWQLRLTKQQETEPAGQSPAIAQGVDGFGMLFDALPDGVVILDTQQRVRRCNHRASAILNRSLEQLRGQTLDDLIDLERALQVAGKVCRLDCPGAETRYVEVSEARAESQERFVFIRDVTQRYQAEKEHRLLRACVAQIDDTIMITESHPLEMPGPRIVFVNEAVERITGYPREALIGRTPRVLQGPATDPGSRKRIRAALDSYEPVREVLVNYTSGGEPFWNQLDIVPFTFMEEGETFFCSVHRDVTEQRQREDRLRRVNLALEEVREQERARIARDLHDELGQLLSAIKLDLLRIRRADSGDQVLSLVDSCNETAEQAIGQVRSIATELRPSLLDDLGFVAAARYLLEQWRSRLEARLHWHGPDRDVPQLPEPVANALFRVLQESLTNISRHARATQVDVSFEVEAGTAILKVEDDGVGFSPGRGDSSGLGLVGMRERVAALGGSMQLVSAPGEGCYLSAKVPVKETPINMRHNGDFDPSD